MDEHVIESIKSGATKAAEAIARGGKALAVGTKHEIDKHVSSPLLDVFQTGNIIQLISKSSGKCLQIIARDGDLILDGKGAEGPNETYAHWTVINDGNNYIRLHQKENFIGIKNDQTVLIKCTDLSLTIEETRFRLSQSNQFITLEALRQKGKFVGILINGELKEATEIDNDDDCYFGVRVIYTNQNLR